MIAGHFGFAAMVKSRERTAPLWAPMLATVWIDVLFVSLLLAHRETVQTVHGGYGGLMIHADYTHAIVGMLLLSALLGAMFFPRQGWRVALMIALASASHWVLDLVVHRPDMPVLPGKTGIFPASAWDCGTSRGSRHRWSCFSWSQARSCTGAPRRRYR